MQLEARCSCGHLWFVAPELAGGLTNCPRCGKATQVKGLRDPFWRVLQVVALVVWVLVVALLHTNAGLVWALVGGVGLAALYALICALM